MPILLIVFLAALFLGSVLNVIAFRVMHDQAFIAQCFCPSCSKKISIFDQLPVLPWLLHRGRCRDCGKPLSKINPFIELMTGLIMCMLVWWIIYPGLDFSEVLVAGVLPTLSWHQVAFFFTHVFVFSVLLLATRTDLEAMVIPQIFSIMLVPVGWLLSYLGFTSIGLFDSVLGAFFGYGLLWAVNVFYCYLAKKEGVGIGDMELLAFIGSFFGPLAVWYSLMIGAVLGLCGGGLYVLVARKGKDVHFPFGPFLVLGVAIYFFFEPWLKEVW